MAACERCWADSRIAHDSIARYHELLIERKCTPEQQAGPLAALCETCQRHTRHQHCGVCMACGEERGVVRGDS